LAADYSVIGIEDLNVKGMLANHKLAKHIADGAKVASADPFFPSSKTCHACGAIHSELKLSDREWDCQRCGAHHHRDVNAARNLEK
jgi:putative transposase